MKKMEVNGQLICSTLATDGNAQFPVVRDGSESGNRWNRFEFRLRTDRTDLGNKWQWLIAKGETP